MRSALHGVNGITKIEAPGNIPKICFVSFSSPDGMRDFVHQQKSNSQFGQGKMWASPSSTPAERKARSILSRIKRGICEHFYRSSESVIIDGPNKSVYSIEHNGALMEITSLKVASDSTIFCTEWVPGTPLALYMHVKLLMNEME